MLTRSRNRILAHNNKQRAEGFSNFLSLVGTIIMLVALVRHVFRYLSSSSVITGTERWELGFQPDTSERKVPSVKHRVTAGQQISEGSKQGNPSHLETSEDRSHCTSSSHSALHFNRWWNQKRNILSLFWWYHFYRVCNLFCWASRSDRIEKKTYILSTLGQ